MSDKRKRAARVIMAETGMKYTAALREADRRHAEAQADKHPPVPAAVFRIPVLPGTPRFASGGTTAPPADDSDSVPALLERGCAYIIVRDETGHGECG